VAVSQAWFTFVLAVVFRTTAGDMTLFETEADKYAAFRTLSYSADNTAGVCLGRVEFL